MILVNDFLEHSADKFPNKIALICEESRSTYNEINILANRLANALNNFGICRGDRVIIYLPNSKPLVVALFATLKANGVFVIVNPGEPVKRLVKIVENCQASAIIAPGRIAATVENILNNSQSLRFAILTDVAPSLQTAKNGNWISYDFVQSEYPSCCPQRKCIDKDLACLVYTSGSTGDAKGIMSDHSNVVFAASSIITYLENNEEDIVISALPSSFDYGLYQILMTFKFGGTLVLEKNFVYPTSFLLRMETENATGLPGVPMIFSKLLQLDISQYDLSSLRYMTNTAAALPPNHIHQIRAMFPHVALYSMYGLSETKRTLFLPTDQLDERSDSVGIAIPGTEVWIEDENGNRLGSNEVGELVIRGGHVMRGYWQNNDATTNTFRKGKMPGERYCYSGDLFRMDNDGYLYFMGRKDDIFKSRGKKVAPKEIEDVIYDLPEVDEVVVVGVPDNHIEHKIKACIVSHKNNLTTQAVLQHCKENLDSFLIPQIIEFRDTLPKSSNGKIQKEKLI